MDASGKPSVDDGLLHGVRLRKSQLRDRISGKTRVCVGRAAVRPVREPCPRYSRTNECRFVHVLFSVRTQDRFAVVRCKRSLVSVAPTRILLCVRTSNSIRPETERTGSRTTIALRVCRPSSENRMRINPVTASTPRACTKPRASPTSARVYASGLRLRAAFGLRRFSAVRNACRVPPGTRAQG